MSEGIALGQRIARWRESRGYTQASLAAKIEKLRKAAGESVGCSPSAIAQWELNQTTPTTQNLGFLTDALDITLAQFWGRVPPEKKKREAKAS